MQQRVEHKRVGWAVTRAGDAAVVAGMRQVTPSQVYRWRKGASGSVEYAAHVHVAQLSATAQTEADAFLTSLKVEALVPGLRLWDSDSLIREWHRLMYREAIAEAEEELASRSDDWIEFMRAHLEEAAIQERLVAVTQILTQERGINPRMYSKDAHRIIARNQK